LASLGDKRADLARGDVEPADGHVLVAECGDVRRHRHRRKVDRLLVPYVDRTLMSVDVRYGFVPGIASDDVEEDIGVMTK
jgi:hypothetical protein